MKRHQFCLFLIVFSLAALWAGNLSAADITLESLLMEMTHRAAIAEFPDPYYTCKQASSYDRRSVAPDEPGWYANADTAQFIREEMNGDRKEWVLMDAEGPGAIVRWWITAPRYHSTFRIYLDGSDTPAIEAKIDELVGGDFLVGAPLSAEKARGRNLYLPIPYAKHCKVTVDDMPTQGNLYYQINYRTYEKGAKVESFSMEGFGELSWLVEQTQNELSEELNFTGHEKFDLPRHTILKAGESKTVTTSPERSMAIDFIDMHLDADDLPQALRSTLICISFDGKETVRCPAGDFFGSGVGINPYQSRYTAVSKKGWMESRWFMPYQSKMEIKLVNLSEQDVKYYIQVGVYDIDWHPNTMYFHCNWRQDREIETLGGGGIESLIGTGMDWNYITIQGKGVFAGDSLTLLNRHIGWWGEGDEKIYVDGETFPSHFGTGTEDYYGYAWCTPAFFEAPFHTQPRAEGPQNYGNITNSRYRALDAIPFQKDFRFDMELWHWNKTKVDYAVTTYWYALGDATTNQPDNIVEEARSKVSYDSEEYVFELPGYEIANKPKGNLHIQDMAGFRGGKWHNDEQLRWIPNAPGDELQLKVKTDISGKQKLVVGMTKAIDYGIMQFSIDGKDIGQPVDLFNDGVIHSGMLNIGTVDLEAGEHTLGVKIVGKNAKATNFAFGMDKFEFVPAE